MALTGLRISIISPSFLFFTHLTSGNNTPGAVPVLVIDAERSDARVMGFTVQYSAFDKEGSTIYP